MKTQLLMLAMATSTFAQTRNGTQDGGNSTGEANSQKDLPSSAGGTMEQHEAAQLATLHTATRCLVVCRIS